MSGSDSGVLHDPGVFASSSEQWASATVSIPVRTSHLCALCRTTYERDPGIPCAHFESPEHVAAEVMLL